MNTLYIASSNSHKIDEISQMLTAKNFDVRGISLLKNYESPEETGKTFEDNAAIKARSLRAYLLKNDVQAGTHLTVLADDSGLECEDLNGAPGVYSARFAGINANDAANNAKLIEELSALPHATRKARFVCALHWIAPDGRESSIRETCEGLILLTPQGKNGFGYDPYFYLSDLQKTMAEIAPEIKNQISHRGKALQKMLQKL